MMRRCPKCRKIYETELSFCTADGTLLVSRDFFERQTLRMFGDEAETRRLPSLPLPAMLNPTVAAGGKSGWNSPFALVGLLLVTLLLSGGFVWAAINVVTANNRGENAAQSGKSPQKEAAKTDAPENVENADGKKVVVKTGGSQTPPTGKPAKSEQFNGRVIMLNAVLRAAPTMEANEAAILPLDAPVKIGRKASANSPWYRVVSASGKQGWMHGNTIEFK